MLRNSVLKKCWRRHPVINGNFGPRRHRHRANAPTLPASDPAHTSARPAAEYGRGKGHNLSPPEATSEHQGKNPAIPLAFQGFAIWQSKQLFGLGRSKPIARFPAGEFDTFHAANCDRHTRIKRAIVCQLRCQPPHGRQPHIDGGWCESLAFQPLGITTDKNFAQGAPQAC